MGPHGFSAALLVLALVAAGCAGTGRPDIEAARSFDDHPLYWVGESFEGWDLKNVAVGKVRRPGSPTGRARAPA